MDVHEKIFEYLRVLGVPFINFSHPPAFTCEQMAQYRASIPVPFGEVKNLFLKDKKKRYYLLSALYETRIDLKFLARALDAPELRFARPDELETVLGVTPGSVTPFALINDHGRSVSVVLDEALLAAGSVGIHPLRNDMTTIVATADLLCFLSSLGYEYRVTSGSGLLGGMQQAV